MLHLVLPSRKINRLLIGLFTVILGVSHTSLAKAESTVMLPLSLSMEAVSETIRACDAKGYKVAVTVVDPDGVIKVEARGDGSPIHSQRFSYRKAYTIVSMGPMFAVDTSSSLVKTIAAFPQGLANVQSGSTDLLFLAGASLIKAGKETIGAIGVSGAPSSADDEACAQAGISRIQTRLDASIQ
jgi:uncharacterized protein GlcG (DUF336 family)